MIDPPYCCTYFHVQVYEGAPKSPGRDAKRPGWRRAGGPDLPLLPEGRAAVAAGQVAGRRAAERAGWEELGAGGCGCYAARAGP